MSQFLTGFVRFTHGLWWSSCIYLVLRALLIFDRLSEIKYFPCLVFSIAHCTWTACTLLFLTIIYSSLLLFPLFFTLSVISVLPWRSHSKSEKAQDLISSMFSRLSSAAEVEVTAAGLNANSIQFNYLPLINYLCVFPCFITQIKEVNHIHANIMCWNRAIDLQLDSRHNDLSCYC